MMKETMETAATTTPIGSKRDYLFGTLSGLAIGVLLMPILKTAKPDLYLSLRFVVIPVFTVLVPLGLVIASRISRFLPVIWQLSKFIVIGVLNALVDIGTLSFMLYLASASSYPIASGDTLFVLFVPVAFFTLYKSISFLIANMNSYFWNKHWTFEVNHDKKTSTEFIQFFVISFVGFIINVVASSLVFHVLHNTSGMSNDQWAIVGAVTGSFAGLAWNFIGYKYFVFKK